MDHFRQISLWNVTYKTISKILADIIKPQLQTFISPLQTTFVCGRNIHENTIITQEIMNYLHHKKSSKGFMAIKVDLEKAFDRVKWDLLSCIPSNRGFYRKFTCWNY